MKIYCLILSFWVYIVGSSIEANGYRYTLSVTNNSGDEKYNHYGKVFTLDVDEAAKGSGSIMEIETAQRSLASLMMVMIDCHLPPFLE